MRERGDSGRANLAAQVSANRHQAEFNLTDPTDIDSQLVGWMKKAYSLTT